MAKVFLGGTCAGSKWREDLIRMLDTKRIGYFDPVVPDWNAEAQAREVKERETCDYRLYWITPEMKGVYSIAEVVDDSNKRPTGTLFGFDVISTVDPAVSMPIEQVKSLAAVGKMVVRNGGRWFKTLAEVAKYLNGKEPS